MHLVLRASGVVFVAVILAACKESTPPLVPANLQPMFASPTDAVAGASLTDLPAVRVTTADGVGVGNVVVTFAVTAGNGLISGASQVTDANGVARLGSWQLGTTVGLNTVTASVGSLTPVQFNITSVPGPAVKLGLTTFPPATVQNRQPFSTQPVIQVQDAFSNPVAQSGVTVTAELASASSATLLGTTTATTDATGKATFTDLAIGGTAGTKSLSFTAASFAGVIATVSTTAGVASAISAHAGDAQSAGAGTAVHTPPAAKVTDIDGNGVPGVLVTFAITGGGGSVTSPTATTNGSGIATVGSWTLGSDTGTNTMTATANVSLSGNPVSFSATGVPFNISAVSPSLLAPGVTGTLSGTGFSATVGDNAVTVDGTSATVLTASASEITFVVPNNMPCRATHDGTVVLTISGGSITKTHPVQPGILRTLAPGQMVVVGDPAQTRCNELSSTGGLYYINVHNTSETFTATPAAFELRGASATGAMALNAIPRSFVPPPLGIAEQRSAGGAARAPAPAEGERLHLRLLEENTRLLERNARGHYARLKALRSRTAPRAALTRQAAVGDQVTLRVPNASAVPFTCSNYFDVNGRIVYQGTRSIIVEDNANPLAGTIDTTYQAIGQEFDAVMFDVLSANFGNPLAMDDVTDNNDRIVMVFTNEINTKMSGLAGFVASCDFFTRNTTDNTTSNFGEYFYSSVPTVAGSFNTQTTGRNITPPVWLWQFRHVVIHEAKHITSFAERLSRDASVFEASWLEESTAGIAQELFGRAVYGLTARANTPYGDANNPAGPYCDHRPTFSQCAGKPWTVAGLFRDLYVEWYASPESHSPIGRAGPSDFSFYNTGWSFVRWAVDQSSGTDAAFLSALTQATAEQGIANLVARSGRSFAQMLPEWTFALALDDHPGFTTTLSNIKMLSWNFRDVFRGLSADFPSSFGSPWPLAITPNSFGTFTSAGGVLPGTAKLFTVSGAQPAKQLIELKASGSEANAPAELRIAIVRVQ